MSSEKNKNQSNPQKNRDATTLGDKLPLNSIKTGSITGGPIMQSPPGKNGSGKVKK
jgi:hypothetical protein